MRHGQPTVLDLSNLIQHIPNHAHPAGGNSHRTGTTANGLHSASLSPRDRTLPAANQHTLPTVAAAQITSLKRSRIVTAAVSGDIFWAGELVHPCCQSPTLVPAAAVFVTPIQPLRHGGSLQRA